MRDRGLRYGRRPVQADRWHPSPQRPLERFPLPGHAAGAAPAHPLAEASASAALRARAREIESAFAAIAPALERLAPRQFEPGFDVAAELEGALGVSVPAPPERPSWQRPLDLAALHARCTLAVFVRLLAQPFDPSHAASSEGESAETLIRRWGFHALDITTCADGRLAGVVDFVLRVPPAIVSHRAPRAGAMFDVEEALARWESVELRRWRESWPNPASEPTRYLKVGVYHFSSADPAHEGCAAHGSDAARAAAALRDRLDAFAAAVERTHCCGASVATLLVGVDTDTDAIRVHVPDAGGRMAVERFVDNAQLYGATAALSRTAAKEAIRAAVAECAGADADDPATEGMRWLCGYLLKNNLAQVDAVRAWFGAGYPDRGHAEKLVVVGDALDAVQLRNVAFQVQADSVEEGAPDLDVGVSIVGQALAAQGLALPVLVHRRYDGRIPGARARAVARAHAMRDAFVARYAAARPVVATLVSDAGQGRPELVDARGAAPEAHG